MQPKTEATYDRKTFERHKTSIKNLSRAVRGRRKDPAYAARIPNDIGLQVTRRCNLRCKTCFLWNGEGHFLDLNKDDRDRELDVNIIEKIFRETREVKSKMYMWGAEAMLHTEWETIAKFIEHDPRWTVICTNGLLLEEKMESLLPVSENLAIVVSLDGFPEEHNAIRGKKTFERTMKNVDVLLAEQRKGHYKGTLSFHCVINDHIIPRLYEFAEYCEGFGVDTLYLGFPWYISKETATSMDNYYDKEFKWLKELNNGPKPLIPFPSDHPTWHTYTYHVQENLIGKLQEQLEMLMRRTLKIRIRLQPPLEMHELRDYLVGREMPVGNRTQCYALSNRCDVLADGNVTTCQPFAEMTVGNLNEKGLMEIWESEEYRQVRQTIGNDLTPICSKCILLFLNGNYTDMPIG